MKDVSGPLSRRTLQVHGCQLLCRSSSSQSDVLLYLGVIGHLDPFHLTMCHPVHTARSQSLTCCRGDWRPLATSCPGRAELLLMKTLRSLILLLTKTIMGGGGSSKMCSSPNLVELR